MGCPAIRWVARILVLCVRVRAAHSLPRPQRGPTHMLDGPKCKGSSVQPLYALAWSIPMGAEEHCQLVAEVV